MKKFLNIILSAAVLCSCSSVRYNVPSVVYRSRILPGRDSGKEPFTQIDDLNNKKLSRNFNSKGKILVYYVSYDQFDLGSNTEIPPGFYEGLGELYEELNNSKKFSEVEMISFSHIKIETISEMLNVAKRYGADYILAVNSSYNLYRYPTTWGYFIAWVPIINLMVPYNRVTSELFVQGTLISKDGAILFTDVDSLKLSENTNVFNSNTHKLRLSREIHSRTYSGLAKKIIGFCK